MACTCVRRSICQVQMFCKNGLFFRPAILRTRSYALNYKQPKEESLAYGKFRRELTALRKQYQEQWQEQQEMKMEAFSAKAAEEGRMKRLQEARALDENKRELERMAKRRVKAMAIQEERLQRVREAGELAREVREQKLADQRAEQVLSLQNESHDFITFDNLDEKIEEVIQNEVNYDFALTHSGEKIT